jgi:ribosomal protein S18 acetylase RimI-like enzyme
MRELLVLRQAKDKDLPFLADIFLRAMVNHVTAARGYWDEAKEHAQFLEQLQLEQTQVVERDGVRIGFFMTAERGQDIELHTLCIAPEYQRHGLGTTIMRQLMEAAFDRKRSIVLSVLKVNTAALSFYTRLGFILTTESAHHYHMRWAS